MILGILATFLHCQNLGIFFNSWYSFTFSCCISYVLFSCLFVNNYDARFVALQFMAGLSYLWVIMGPLAGEVLWILTCPSVCTYVCNQFFSESVHSTSRNRNSWQKWVFQKNSCLSQNRPEGPKIGKKCFLF